MIGVRSFHAYSELIELIEIINRFQCLLDSHAFRTRVFTHMLLLFLSLPFFLILSSPIAQGRNSLSTVR